MARSTADRLAAYERQYRDLARQLADIGYIAGGSLALRPNRCGKPTCRCHDDPPQLHGPYWRWTAKVNGKTVNRRLTPPRPSSTGSGSTTIDVTAPWSTRCGRSLRKPPNETLTPRSRHPRRPAEISLVRSR